MQKILDITLGLIDQSRRPGLNEDQENKLRRELEATAELAHSEACDKVAALDEEHKERRGWVWAQLGESPFALALEPLGRLARAAKRTLGGANAEALIADYVAEGWRCDLAALEALSTLKPGAEHNLITKVVRALYEPWLDRSARRFQGLLSGDDADPGKLAAGIEADAETCVLFTDGLRFDLGMMLQERLESRGIKTRLSHRVAPIPTVTASAKPLASLAHSSCAGGSDAEDFYPLVSDSGKPANAARLRDAMARQGVEILEDGETRMAVGSEAGAWTEMGKIDSLGHSLDAALVRQIEPEIESIVERIDALLNAGWSKVRVVTDHGWLLLPAAKDRAPAPSRRNQMGALCCRQGRFDSIRANLPLVLEPCAPNSLTAWDRRVSGQHGIHPWWRQPAGMRRPRFDRGARRDGRLCDDYFDYLARYALPGERRYQRLGHLCGP